MREEHDPFFRIIVFGRGQFICSPISNHIRSQPISEVKLITLKELLFTAGQGKIKLKTWKK